MTSRRRTAIAIAASVLLHVAFFAILLLWVRPLPPAPRRRPFNVQIVELPPLPPPRPKTPRPPSPAAPPASPPSAAPIQRQPPKLAHRPPVPPKAGTPAAPVAPAPPPSAEQPKVTLDVPHAVPQLVPHEVPGGIPLPEGNGSSGGHLTRNDGKTAPTQEEIAQQDAAARDRVQGFANDVFARTRVTNGLVDGFFADLGQALEAAVKDPPPFALKSGPSYARTWQRDAEQFGKTGALEAGRIPQGEMRDFENHHDPIPEPGTNAELIQNGLAGTALRRHTSEEAAEGGGLVAVVELRQARDGKVEQVALRRSSGNKRFDAFVLDSARKGAQNAPPLPDQGAGIHAEGTRSVWAFKGSVVYVKSTSQLKKEGKSTAGVVARSALSLLTGGLGFDENKGELDVEDSTPSFRVKVALLAVY